MLCPRLLSSVFQKMIIRVFRAQVQPGAHAEYERLVREQAIPFMQKQLGLGALHVGVPMPQSPDEFVMVSVRQDFQAMKQFTGEQWQNAVVLSGEERLVARMTVDHYASL